MGKIIVLDELTANQIAAGEVVERPASVVKELVENSIDAGADRIRVDIRGGGIKYIRVTDNGSGIEQDDVELAFERHATSKLRTAADLENGILTRGFRGEALASIAAVSEFEMLTKTKDAQYGTRALLRGGDTAECEKAGAKDGTVITVKELFFNTPARYKFLKKDSTEASAVADTVTKMALSVPNVAMSLYINNEQAFATSGSGSLEEAVYSVFGKYTADNVVKLDYSEDGIRVWGFVGNVNIMRGNRANQIFYINGRYFKSRTVAAAVEAGYGTMLMKGRYPFALLNIETSPAFVDVNVHPQKTEVRFSDEAKVGGAVRRAVRESMESVRIIPEMRAGQHTNAQNDIAAHTEGAAVADGNAATGSNAATDGNAATGSNTAINRNGATNGNAATDRYSDVKKAVAESFGSYKPAGAGTYSYGIRNEEPQKSGVNARESSRPYEVNKPAADRSETVLPQTEMFGRGNAGTNMNLSSEDGLISAEEETANTSGFFNKEVSSLEYVGTFFNTFLLFQSGRTAYIVDQHAAHERIKYEKLKKEFEDGSIEQQSLLLPETVTLNPEEYQSVFDYRQDYEKIGIIFEDFGKNTVVIRTIPADAETDGIANVFRFMLDQLRNGGTLKAKADQILYKMACGSAIKANKHLHPQQIDALINELAKMENPFNCPHGRPTVIRLPEREIEKWFKRIV